jgi:ABC-type Co2+ transport system permease subunit
MKNQIRFKKIIQTALLAALCFVSFTYLQIKIPVPGGDATSLHIGNTFCVLAAWGMVWRISRSNRNDNCRFVRSCIYSCGT